MIIIIVFKDMRMYSSCSERNGGGKSAGVLHADGVSRAFLGVRPTSAVSPYPW